MLNIKENFEINFIKIIVGLNVFLQVVSVLRASALFNTAYVSNFFRLLIISIFGIWFIFKTKIKKNDLDIWDGIFLFIPLGATIWGIYFCGLSRYTFSDLFNAVAFWMIFYTYKKRGIVFEQKLWIWIADIEMIGIIISFILYSIFPMIGFPIYSTGKVSNFLLLPLAIYLIYGNKRGVITLILILCGGKRGVMLAALCMLLVFFLISPKINKKIKIGAVVGIVIIGGGVCWLTYSPERFAFVGPENRSIFERIMLINPFSTYRDYYRDGRMDEVISALKSIQDNPFKIFIGNGNGFTYEYYFKGELKSLTQHNVHISPVDLITKYGIIYAVVMYANALAVFVKGTKKIYVKYDKEVFIMMLYICGTLVDSLTACLFFADYQYIIILGALNGVLLKKQSKGDYKANEIK